MSHIVKNNTVAIHSIPIDSDIIVLVPGDNHLSQDHFEKFAAHPTVKERVSAGKYSVNNSKSQAPVEAPVEVEETEEDKQEAISNHGDLAFYSINAAKKLVKETKDIDALEKWLSGETRHKVKEVIEIQIKALKKG